ncbi:MAG: helix-turn-helix transcriptional regulator, partial [Blautia sp.]|nr:helix-turn-helix transcriptional regulator [Blautia sp.]
SQATLSSWKSGKYTPKIDKLKKLADYFGVPIEELMA